MNKTMEIVDNVCRPFFLGAMKGIIVFGAYFIIGSVGWTLTKLSVDHGSDLGYILSTGATVMSIYYISLAIGKLFKEVA